MSFPVQSYPVQSPTAQVISVQNSSVQDSSTQNTSTAFHFDEFFSILFNAIDPNLSKDQIADAASVILLNPDAKLFIISEGPQNLFDACTKRCKELDLHDPTGDGRWYSTFKDLVTEVQTAAFRHSDYWDRLTDIIEHFSSYIVHADVPYIEECFQRTQEALQLPQEAMTKEQLLAQLKTLQDLKEPLISIRSIGTFSDPRDLEVFTYLLDEASPDLYPNHIIPQDQATIFSQRLSKICRWVTGIEKQFLEKNEGPAYFQRAGQFIQQVISLEIQLRRQLAELEYPPAATATRSPGQRLYDIHGLAMLQGTADLINKLFITCIKRKGSASAPFVASVHEAIKSKRVEESSFPSFSKLQRMKVSLVKEHIDTDFSNQCFDLYYPNHDIEQVAIELINKMNPKKLQALQSALTEPQEITPMEKRAAVFSALQLLVKDKNIDFTSLNFTSLNSTPLTQ